MLRFAPATFMQSNPPLPPFFSPAASSFLPFLPFLGSVNFFFAFAFRNLVKACKVWTAGPQE